MDKAPRSKNILTLASRPDRIDNEAQKGDLGAMGTAPEIVELGTGSVALAGKALHVMEPAAPGTEPTVSDGYAVGLSTMERPPPHLGERHPDGDELVILVGGEAT